MLAEILITGTKYFGYNMSLLPVISDNKGKIAVALALTVVLISSFAVLYGTDEAYAASYDVTIDDLVYDLDDMGDSDPDNNIATVTDVSSAGMLLAEISIPSTVTYEGVLYSVTSIGESAFYNCTGLTSLTIPASVTSIGRYVFFDCTGLTEFVVSTDNANYSNDGRGILYNKDKTSLIQCPEGYGGDVVIPDSVTSIGDLAFYNCTGLTSVTIPSSVTSIGEGTFYYCIGLTSLTIPSSVTSIGNYAFYYCTGLTSVTIPEGVTSIGWYAFSNCAGLTSVTIPASVTYIDQSAFESCTGLTSVTILDGITSIGDYAFSNCMGLTSVTIPASVASIGGGAFLFCTGLTSVTILDGITSIENNVFYGCTGLTSVTIPDSVTSIGSNAFCRCSGLTFLTIPNNVTSIGGYAFSECSGLTSLTIPNNVTSIGFNAFSGCTGLMEFVVSAGNANYSNDGQGILYNKDKTSLIQCPGGYEGGIVIPDSVTSIGGSAFSGCIGLTSVTIPASVTSIGSYAFSGCTDLTEFFVSVHNANYSNDGQGILYNKGRTSLIQCPGGYEGNVVIPDSVTSISNYAFSGCTSLTSVTIPDSVTSISWYAFYGCTGLTSVTIPSSVTSISDSAFRNCTGLTSVTISEGVTSIGGSAFSGCTGLTSVTIPEGVTSIDQSVFSGCTGLTSVTIPEGVTSIDHYAFYNCIGLTSVTIPASVTSIGIDAFYGLTFVAEDGTTILEHTFENLSGYRFAGTYESMIRVAYTVTYSVDGGSASAPVQSALSEGRSFIIADYDGTKDGYTFGGWTDGINVYKAGDEYIMGTSDVTLTAIWETIDVTDGTVSIVGALIVTIVIVMVAVLYGRRAAL